MPHHCTVPLCSSNSKVPGFLFYHLPYYSIPGMGLGFEEWLVVIQKCFKSPKLVIFTFYGQIIPRKFLVDTIYVHMYVLHKAAGN